MNLSPVVIAIPMYFILMALEMIVLRFQKHSGYRLNDAITNNQLRSGLSGDGGIHQSIIHRDLFTYFTKIWHFFKLQYY